MASSSLVVVSCVYDFIPLYFTGDLERSRADLVVRVDLVDTEDFRLLPAFGAVIGTSCVGNSGTDSGGSPMSELMSLDPSLSRTNFFLSLSGSEKTVLEDLLFSPYVFEAFPSLTMVQLLLS